MKNTFDYNMLCEKYKLSDSELHVLRYIDENIKIIHTASIRDVAQICFCSTSVIMALAKKLGYIGYKDMIKRIENELKGNKKLLAKNIQYLEEFTNFDHEISKTFTNLLKEHSDHVIYLTGSGFNTPLINYMQEKLMILGFKSFITWHMENYVNPLHEKPLFISVSKSGETDFILRLAKYCKKNDYKIISFTHRKENTLMQLSDVNFQVFDSAILNESNAISNSFYSIVLFLFEHLVGCYLNSQNE